MQQYAKEFTDQGSRWRVYREAPTSAHSSQIGATPSGLSDSGVRFVKVDSGETRFLALDYLNDLPSKADLVKMKDNELSLLLRRASRTGQ